MKMRHLTRIGAVACLAVIPALTMTGCAEIPFTELKETQAAREEARGIALDYAPDDYNSALALYDQARLELEAQAGNSGWSRSYTNATELLAQAKQGFEAAVKTSLAMREKLKAQAEEKSALATAAIEEVGQALEGVRKTSRNRNDRERWRQSIEGLTYTLEDANEYLSSEYYRDSIGYFDTIIGDCETIKAEITGG
jgi:hypothetical protein